MAEKITRKVRDNPVNWAVSFDGEFISFQGRIDDPGEVEQVVRALLVNRALLTEDKPHG